jgi:hypothetical protein
MSDPSGKLLVRYKFDWINPASEGLAEAMLGEHNGFIDPWGNWAFRPLPPRGGLGEFSEGLAIFQLDWNHGYLNHKGQVVITPQYSLAGDFHEGLARVRSGAEADYRWGFIYPDGSWAIQPIFEGALDFSEGAAPVRLGDKVGYLMKGDLAQR